MKIINKSRKRGLIKTAEMGLKETKKKRMHREMIESKKSGVGSETQDKTKTNIEIISDCDEGSDYEDQNKEDGKNENNEKQNIEILNIDYLALFEQQKHVISMKMPISKIVWGLGVYKSHDDIDCNGKIKGTNREANGQGDSEDGGSRDQKTVPEADGEEVGPSYEEGDEEAYEEDSMDNSQEDSEDRDEEEDTGDEEDVEEAGKEIQSHEIGVNEEPGMLFELYIATKEMGLYHTTIDPHDEASDFMPNRLEKSLYIEGKRQKYQAMAVHGDYVVGGTSQGYIHVWKKTKYHGKMRRHREEVNSLVFNEKGLLFSGGGNGVIYYWDPSSLGYLDCLYGHTSSIFDMDYTNNERSVSVGGLDGTVRLWKVADETQLVYGPTNTNLDAVAVLNDTTFVTGGSNGHLMLWTIGTRKPHNTLDINNYIKDGGNAGVVSLSTIHGYNLIFVGTTNGMVFLVNYLDKKLTVLFGKKYEGIISSLAVTLEWSNHPGMGTLHLAIAISSERSQGRWGKCLVQNQVIYTNAPCQILYDNTI